MFPQMFRRFPKPPATTTLLSTLVLLVGVWAHPATAGFLLVRAEGTPIMVVLDGNDVGFSPMLLEDLPAGSHELGFKVSRFGPLVVSRSVEIPTTGGMKVRASLAAASLTAMAALPEEAVLAPPPAVEGPTGELYVAADAPEAWVTLDGQDLNTKAPVLLKNIPVGEHQVRVRSACAAAEAKAQVKEQIIARLELALTPGMGTLELFTTPSEVAVTIDGQPHGTTPQAITDLPCGEHQVELAQEAWYTEALTVFVPAFDRTPIYASLQAIENGTLVIAPEPIDTTVVLDGRELGQGPMSLENMLAGTHELLLRREGYQEVVQIVEVATGEVTRIEQVLQPAPPQVVPEPPVVTEPPASGSSQAANTALPADEPTPDSAPRKVTGGRILLNTAVSVAAVGLSAHSAWTFSQAMDAYQRHQDETVRARYEKIYNEEFLPLYRQSLVEGAGAVVLLGVGTVLWVRTGKTAVGPGPGLGLSLLYTW